MSDQPVVPKPSRFVAEALARVWAMHKTPLFLEYVAESFRIPTSERPQIEALYIYQVAEGDLESGSFTHSTAFQWWQVTDAGIRECAMPDVQRFDEQVHPQSSYFRWPRISFLHVASRVGFGERFGPQFFNRKTGTLVEMEHGVEIVGVCVIKTSQDL